MSLNCNEINLILSDLDLCGGFIQEIIQPGYDTLFFKVINKGELFNLILCVGSNSTRINSTKYKAPKNKKPLRFNEFLKSKIQGMRINSVEQLGLERIIKFDVSTWQERLFIYARLWSNAANIIVTDEQNKILDAMYRRPNKGEVTGGIFNPQVKELSETEKLEAQKKFPIRNFEGVDFKGNDFKTFNEKIDWYYTECSATLSRESLLLQAEKWYNAKKSKMENALNHLLQKKNDFENAGKLKHYGDLILTFANQIDGSNLECVDYETNQKICIKLDSKLNAQQNAQIYYEQYKKSISGMQALEHDIELAEKSMKNLESQYNEILNEKNTLKIEQLLRTESTPKQQDKKQSVGLHYEINGWKIIVGRTAAENDELLRHSVKGQDLWLHTRDFAGGYVFIKARNGKSVPLEILLYAGNLAVYHSKARKNAKADLYYTQVKYLRRAKNGPKGLVLPTQEKNLFIQLDDEKMRHLDEYLVK